MLVKLTPDYSAFERDSCVRIENLLRLSEVEDHRAVGRGHLEVVRLARS